LDGLPVLSTHCIIDSIKDLYKESFPAKPCTVSRFTRKYSAKRHTLTIHSNGGGEIVPFLEYLVRRSTGQYHASNPSWHRRSEKSIHKFGRATADAAQVISNLIDNAIKFTKQGTISIVIDRKRNSDSNSNSPDEVTVSVKDTGSGIHPDILPRLFSKFASKSFQGTGLGLFISKNIIEAHGGKLWGENNADGRGATFTFSLPID
jgi:signal transduction histidine kinase